MSLLEAYGALPESAERMTRVRRELMQAPLRGAQPAWFLRPAVALSLLLGLATVAGATVGRAPLSRWMARVTGASAPVTPVVRQEPAPRRHATVAPETPPPVGVVAPAAPPPVVAAPAPAPATLTPRATHRAAAPTAPALAPSAEEYSLVHEAMKAQLASDHRRGAALAESYLHRYPTGGLVEDALTIWIKALMVEDPARAAVVAQTYRRKFPSGPHLATANAAIAAAAGK